MPETRLALGYYRYYEERDFSAALAEFQQAGQGLPNSADVIKAIGLIHRRVGHWDESIVWLRRAVELDPRNVDAYVGLMITLRSLRRFPEAIAAADQVLAWEPTNVPALRNKAKAFWATGDFKAVEPLLLANPSFRPYLDSSQAFFQRRYAAAIEILSKALADKLDGQNEELLFMLALSQQRAGDVSAARATYQTAAQHFQRKLEKAKPNSSPEAEIRARLALAYAGLGQTALAVAEAQKAIATNPSSKDPLDGPTSEEIMARIYALLGDADHAIPILELLIQIPYPDAITPALLRIDPVWDQVRNNPSFQKLASSGPK